MQMVWHEIPETVRPVWRGGDERHAAPGCRGEACLARGPRPLVRIARQRKGRPLNREDSGGQRFRLEVRRPPATSEAGQRLQIDLQTWEDARTEELPGQRAADAHVTFGRP